MATLKVQPNGNAPSNAKVGDHIVTAGGTYEVLDSSKYSGMSADQLASAGVGYNPSSGLYSKKISDVSTNVGTAQGTTPQLSLRTTDTARQWANQQNQKVSADLDSAFYQNRQDAYNTYMDSITRQNQQANNVNQAYFDNITKLYDDTYANNQAAIQRAASRGLMSSGLGNAMQVSALADASKQNAQYRAQRNIALNNIEAEMNNLTNQYNVNIDTLTKKLRSDKASALSQNEIAFLQAVMDIEEQNTNAENAMLSLQQQQAYEAEQAMLQREFQASESQKDRDFQLLLQQLGLSSGGYGGSGGYRSGGGYRSYGGYGGYGGYGSGGSGGTSGTPLQSAASSYLNSIYGDENISYDTKVALAEGIANNSNGTMASAMIAAKRQERGEDLALDMSKFNRPTNSQIAQRNAAVGTAGNRLDSKNPRSNKNDKRLLTNTQTTSTKTTKKTSTKKKDTKKTTTVKTSKASTTGRAQGLKK